MFFAESSSERLLWTVRMCVPYMLVFGLLFFNLAAFSFPLTGAVKPPLLLMAVYYWSIFRPTLMPFWLVFVMALCLDLLGGFPPGLHAFIYLVLQWLIIDQRRLLLAQPFIVIWSVFALILTVSYLAGWLILSLAQWQILPYLTLLSPVLSGITLYPLIHLCLHLTHKVLPGQEETYRLNVKVS